MNINIYNPYVRRELELYHHGIFGMKWGKKQGPPYPLDASDHSAAEKKAGWQDSLKNGGKESRAERKARKYKEKQLKKIDKKYDADIQWNKSYSYGSLSGNNTKEIENGYNVLRDLEKKHVMNMSIDDVAEEQNRFGKGLFSKLLAATDEWGISDYRSTRMSDADKKKYDSTVNRLWDAENTVTQKIGKYEVKWDNDGGIVSIKDENGNKVNESLFDIDWDDDADRPILNQKPSRKKTKHKKVKV